MTNAFYVALTFKLRTMSSRERAEKIKATEASPWEHLGVERENLDKAVAQVVGTAGVDLLLPFAQRLWNEPVWEFKISALKMLTLDHVEASPEMWRFVLDTAGQVDGPRLAAHLSDVGHKCLADDPSRLDDVEKWLTARHKWTRRMVMLLALPWARAGRDPARVLEWAAKLAGDKEAAVQEGVAIWLRAYGATDASARNAFLAEHGGKMNAEARALAGQ